MMDLLALWRSIENFSEEKSEKCITYWPAGLASGKKTENKSNMACLLDCEKAEVEEEEGVYSVVDFPWLLIRKRIKASLSLASHLNGVPNSICTFNVFPHEKQTWRQGGGLWAFSAFDFTLSQDPYYRGDTSLFYYFTIQYFSIEGRDCPKPELLSRLNN